VNGRGDLVGPLPEDRDPEAYDRLRRRVLWSLPTGLYLVGSRSGDRVNLMTCNLVVQVSTDPKVVAVSVEAGSATRGLINDGGAFTVCLLDRSDRAVVRRFVKPVTDVDRDADGRVVALQGEPVTEVAGGLPVLATAAGWIACAVRATVDPGGPAGEPASHVLFLGEVVDVGERPPDPGGAPVEVLRMEDTRMNYGG
jgi:flavin reductase (DIM6/NTAB) family NADH-FMN oxidoreductase RutF